MFSELATDERRARTVLSLIARAAEASIDLVLARASAAQSLCPRPTVRRLLSEVVADLREGGRNRRA